MADSKTALVRHFSTRYNREGRLQGRRDIPIAGPDPGEKAAMARNRDLLARIGPFERVLASSLQRTRMTAACYGLAYRVEPLLDELDFGPYEGWSRADFIRAVGPLWYQAPQRLTLGEPLTALQERIERFAARYRADARVLAFGHGAWIRAFVSLHRFGTIARMNRLRVDNNDIVVV